MRCRLSSIVVCGTGRTALGSSLMHSRLLFNALQKQPIALCHAPLTNIQKSLQRIFATIFLCAIFLTIYFTTVYLAQCFLLYLFLQQFTLRAVVLTVYFDFHYIFLYI